MAASLDDIAALLRDLIAETKKAGLIQAAYADGVVAPESDTEDPKVHFDLRDWKGPSFKGASYSECPPEFLDRLAATLTRFAHDEKAENKTFKGKPAYIYSLQKAGRCRRWALRKRLGWVPPEKPASSMGGTVQQGLGLPVSGSLAKGLGPLKGIAKPAAVEDDDFPFGANSDAIDEETRQDDDDDMSL